MLYNPFTNLIISGGSALCDWLSMSLVEWDLCVVVLDCCSIYWPNPIVAEHFEYGNMRKSGIGACEHQMRRPACAPT